MSTSGMSIDKKKPSILLMHGSGLTHIVWSLHEQFYSANGFNVLSVDLPGHGESEGPSLKSIESISDWVKSLINVLDLSKISLAFLKASSDARHLAGGRHNNEAIQQIPPLYLRC